jgi:hypothetical protein
LDNGGIPHFVRRIVDSDAKIKGDNGANDSSVSR